MQLVGQIVIRRRSLTRLSIQKAVALPSGRRTEEPVKWDRFSFIKQYSVAHGVQWFFAGSNRVRVDFTSAFDGATLSLSPVAGAHSSTANYYANEAFNSAHCDDCFFSTGT